MEKSKFAIELATYVDCDNVNLIVAYLMFHTVVQRERGSLNFGECNMHYPQGEGQDSDRRSEEETSRPSPVEVGLLANIRHRLLT